jgi:tRNA(Arg) A34 adenosine deaminase TadA
MFVIYNLYLMGLKEFNPFNHYDIERIYEIFAPQVEQMRKEAKPYSFQEYLSLAANQALKALKEGNYGIGAVYVYRVSGQEYVIGGRNGIISRKDTHLHAEQDVIDAVESLARGETKYKDRLILERPAPHGHEERMLVASLEPCIMCAGRIATHKLDTLYIGAKDELAGAMLDERRDGLSVLWKQMLDGEIGLKPGESPKPLKIITPDTLNAESIAYVPNKYIKLQLDIFLYTRQAIDDKMGNRGLSPDLSHLSDVIKGI